MGCENSTRYLPSQIKDRIAGDVCLPLILAGFRSHLYWCVPRFSGPTELMSHLPP